MNEIIRNLKRNKFNNIEISDKKINSLKIEKGWQGDGSEFELIIIDEVLYICRCYLNKMIKFRIRR